MLIKSSKKNTLLHCRFSVTIQLIAREKMGRVQVGRRGLSDESEKA